MKKNQFSHAGQLTGKIDASMDPGSSEAAWVVPKYIVPQAADQCLQSISLDWEKWLKTKILVIYNTQAGQGDAAKKLQLTKDLLGQAGVEYDLVYTNYAGHAIDLARKAAIDGFAVVAAAGGDGTVNEVVNGLMQSGVKADSLPALAVLPVGRGNDFAYGVGIPHDLTSAVQIIIAGQARTIDIGKFAGGDFPQGRYFANGVGLGFDTVVGFEAAKIKWLHGATSYLVALIRTIFLYAKAPVYEVELDGETTTQPFLMISIMNGQRMGGAFYMAPDSNPDDAVLDLCLAGQVPQIKILPLAIKFFSGTQGKNPAVRMTRARIVNIKAIEGSIPAHADGETICKEGKSLAIQIVPGAIRVLTSQGEARA